MDLLNGVRGRFNIPPLQASGEIEGMLERALGDPHYGFVTEDTLRYFADPTRYSPPPMSRITLSS